MRDANEIQTGRLYDADAYLQTFTARVLGLEGGEVVLDRTAFFPEEGGQSADTGSLAGLPVTDVQIKDGVIRHRVSGRAEDLQAAFVPGAEVTGKIDWPRRFSNMQQHSGEHLFSGLVHSCYGFENVGFHLSDREVTVDFDGVLPQDDLTELELSVGRVITANIESRIEVLTPEESKTAIYRSKLDLPGEVRVVTFPGADACACCAPHVKRTGEIGQFKILSAVAWKGGTRVSILCGERAAAYCAASCALLAETAKFLSAAQEEVPGLVKKHSEETVELRRKLRAAEEERLILTARLTGERFLFCEEAVPESVRGAVTALAAEGIPAGVFTGSDEAGYSYCLGCADGDVRPVGAALKEALGARGGGKPEMIQGFVRAGRTQIEAVLRDIPAAGQK